MRQADQVDVEIVQRLYSELRRFSAVVAPLDLDPDDVLHDALVATMRLRRLQSLNDPGAYLRRAIVNEVRSQIRRRRSQRKALSRLRATAEPSSEDAYPSEVADLLRLQPVERAVLYLHDIEGFTFEDVAAIVGITAGNARVTASRARQRLRLEMNEEGRQ